MNGGVMQHGARYRHDRRDRPFGYAVAVVCAHASVPDSLAELLEVSLEVLVAKRCSVITEVFLNDHSIS